MQRCLGILLLLILLIGCKQGPPDGVLKKDVMTNVLYDIHVSEGYLFTSAVDSMRQRTADFNEGIYQHYRTDSTTVRQSLEYYASRPQILKEIYSEIERRLTKVEEGMRLIEDEKYKATLEADSIKRAAVADSLKKVIADSVNLENRKHMLYWKSPDSTDLKPKPWTWENSPSLPLLKRNDVDLPRDTTVIDTLKKTGAQPAPTVE